MKSLSAAMVLTALAASVITLAIRPTSGQVASDLPGPAHLPLDATEAASHATREEVLQQIEQLRTEARAKAQEYADLVVQSAGDVSKDSQLAKAASELANLQGRISQLSSQVSSSSIGFVEQGGYGEGLMDGGNAYGFGNEGAGAMMGGMMGGRGRVSTDPFALQTGVLVEQLRSTEGGPQQQLVEALRRVLNDLYEHRLQKREEQLNRLEQRLAELRAQLKRQRDAKQEVVDIRLKTLVNEAKGIGF